MGVPIVCKSSRFLGIITLCLCPFFQVNCESQEKQARQIGAEGAEQQIINADHLSSHSVDASAESNPAASRVREKNFGNNNPPSIIESEANLGIAHLPDKTTCKYLKSMGNESITNIPGVIPNRTVTVEISLPVVKFDGNYSLAGNIYTFQHRQNYQFLMGRFYWKVSVLYEVRILGIKSEECTAEVKILSKS